jgi:hypothetical protein
MSAVEKKRPHHQHAIAAHCVAARMDKQDGKRVEGMECEVLPP